MLGQPAWGRRHEKSLSRKPRFGGGVGRACDRGELAVQGATSASGGVLRLVRRLRGLQHRRGSLRRHSPLSDAGTPDVTTGNRDGIFGFHAGAQLQWGAWVLGAEAARIACFNEVRLSVPGGITESPIGTPQARRTRPHPASAPAPL